MNRTSLMGILSLALLTGCKPEQPRQAEGAPARTVSVAVATMGRIADRLVLGGTVQAAAEVRVLPRITGRLLDVTVDEGDRVRPGQVLARIETTELEWQREQQRAALATAEAGLAKARSDRDRMRLLLVDGAISRQQFDHAATQAEMSKAQVRQIRAAIRQLDAQIGHGVVVSPIAGTVLARSAETGSLATPGAPLFTLARDGRLSVHLQVPEQHVPLLKAGAPVKVRSSAYPGREFPSRIARVNPAVDPRTRLLPVKVDLPPSELRVGMFVEVEIQEGDRQALVIPAAAIQSDGSGTWVYRVDQGRVRRSPVEIGSRSGDRVEILSGLTAGAKVVSGGSAFLSDGDSVAYAH